MAERPPALRQDRWHAQHPAFPSKGSSEVKVLFGLKGHLKPSLKCTGVRLLALLLAQPHGRQGPRQPGWGRRVVGKPRAHAFQQMNTQLCPAQGALLNALQQWDNSDHAILRREKMPHIFYITYAVELKTGSKLKANKTRPFCVCYVLNRCKQGY